MLQSLRFYWVIAALLGTLHVPASATSAEPAAEGRDAPEDTDPDSLFVEHVEPILQAKCVRCHGSEEREAELDLSSPAGILRGSETGPIVDRGHPDKSALYEMVRQGLMPPEDDGDPLPTAEVETIRRWILEGASFGQHPLANVERPITDHDIIPILLLRCTVCHGRHIREADLDLRDRESMLRGGKSGPALVPGDPEQSLILQRVVQKEMPPIRRLVEASVKPISSDEITLLTQWIEQGAPAAPDGAHETPPENEPTAAEPADQSWAFRRLRGELTIPEVRDPARVRNPIDAFVLARLEAAGLELAPPADRAVIIRRAYLDLTGLPPSPDEVIALLADSEPGAYERMIDRLLDSPAYGERWARHWLDVAGYSDSEGRTHQDEPRPNAYRYRDYVIRAHNDDKPFDRFLVEQLAGDELADYENAPVITQELYDNLVATGFLRQGPDGTWSRINSLVPDRLEVIANMIDVVGSGVFALTFKCARCHSHKFDPIPHGDYYRLSALFKGALDEHDWLNPNPTGLPVVQWKIVGPRNLPYVTPSERNEWERQNARVDAQVDELKAKSETLVAQRQMEVFEQRLSELPEDQRTEIRLALDTQADQRDQQQTQLFEEYSGKLRPETEELKELDADFKKTVDELAEQIETVDKSRPAEPMIRALWDRGHPSPTYLLRRGNYSSPGHWVEARVPGILNPDNKPLMNEPPWPGAEKTGRRLAFARAITDGESVAGGLVARVAVNRIWKHHFDDGIVKTMGNFGKSGAPPTHPELLEWLAAEFVRREWSVKAIHRLIMNSSTYRQSSAIDAAAHRLDPYNRLLSRYPFTRLDAEALRDSLLFVADRLDATPYGPPDGVDVQPDGLVTSLKRGDRWRRSIYVQQRRTQTPTILEVFDLPAMNPNCLARSRSTVAPQALHMMNNQMIHELARSLAERVVREVGMDPQQQIERVFLTSIGRLPTNEEKELAGETLQQLTSVWAEQAEAQPDASPSAVRALENVCHGLLNSAEFVYID